MGLCCKDPTVGGDEFEAERPTEKLGGGSQEGRAWRAKKKARVAGVGKVDEKNLDSCVKGVRLFQPSQPTPFGQY